MQPVLQNAGGPGQGHKETGGHCGHQGNGQHLNAQAYRILGSRQRTQAQADKKTYKAVKPLKLFRTGGLFVVLRKGIHVSRSPQQGGLAVQIIGFLYGGI